MHRVNEAFQFLTKKQKKLSGRSMVKNWQVVGEKSKTMQTILVLKSKAVDQPLKDPNPLATVLRKNEQRIKLQSAQSVAHSDLLKPQSGEGSGK